MCPLPNVTFMYWIHLRSSRTIIIFREILHIAEGHNNPIFIWRMFIRNNKLFKFLFSSFRAPDARRRHPKQLSAGQVDPWQFGLLTPIPRQPLFVSHVGFLDTAVVGDVLPLRVNAIQLQVPSVFFVFVYLFVSAFRRVSREVFSFFFSVHTDAPASRFVCLSFEIFSRFLSTIYY